MIKDLIVRLMEEANEEAEHKGWCDTELASNKQTREAKTEEVDTLASQRDQLSADIAKLGEEITELSAAIAAIDKAVAEATALVQQSEADAPETFDAPYKGMGGESGGVVGMLEVIQSDFARLEAETSSSESEAADEFD